MSCSVSFSLKYFYDIVIQHRPCMEHLISLLLQCLQSRGINELLLTSDNWEGLRYGGMEGGNADIRSNSCVKKEKKMPSILYYV